MSLKKQFLKSKPVCKVTFSLPVEALNTAKEVKLVGDFNNWQWEKGVPMKRRNKEYVTSVELEKNKQFQFRYLADNEVWENDWEADAYQESPFGNENSVVNTEYNGR